MTPSIEYFYTTISPWAYLGHDQFLGTAAKYGATVIYKPVNLNVVFPETGGLPLAKRAPARQKYRFVEMKRWKERRSLPLNLQPAHFPTNPALADRTVIAIAEAGGDPADFLGRAFRAVWAYDRDVADEHVIEGLLSDTGQDARTILEAAKSDAIEAIYAAYTQDAVDRSVFGSPTYVLAGEPFWGQDRIDLLADALESGRAPYLP